MQTPVIVIGLPRSGTSMVTGIFVEHGYWVGYSAAAPSNEIHSKHLGYYENKRAAMMMLKFRNRASNLGGVSRWAYGFDGYIKEFLEKEEYPGGSWVVKFGACDVIPWRVEFPNATVVSVRRPISSIRKSSPKTSDVRIQTYTRLMKWVEQSGGFRVDYNRIVDGDCSQLVPIFEKEGVGMDRNIIEGFVDKKLRRF